MLRVSTQQYEVKETDFEVTLKPSDSEMRFEWDLDIRAFSEGREPVRIRSHAAHYLDPLPAFPNPLAFSEWSANLPDTAPDDEPGFMAYCYEHEPLRDVAIKVRSVSPGQIELSLSARTDIYVAEDCPTEDVEIRLQSTIRLAGFYVWEDDTEKASRLLSRAANLKLFSAPIRRGPGFIFPLRHDA